MNSAPQLSAAPQPAPPRPVTRYCVAGLVLLVPITVGAWVAVLATARGTDCIEYSERCSTVPGSALYVCFWVAVAAGLLALEWPWPRWVRARAAVVVLQWGVQLTLGALILSRGM